MKVTTARLLRRLGIWLTLLLGMATFLLSCNTEDPGISIELPDAGADQTTPNASSTITLSRADRSSRTPTTEPSPPPTPPVERLKPPDSVPPSEPYEPLTATNDPRLEDLLQQALGEEAKSFGIVVKNLADGRTVAINPDKTFYAASLFKLPILYEAFKQMGIGLLDPTLDLTINPYYASFDLGTLELLGLGEGDTITVAKAIYYMITVSDNVSAVLLQDLVGPHHVDSDLTALGLRNTAINTPDLSTSARDMALLLEMIALGKAVSPEASQQMRDILLDQRVRHSLPALLPEGTPVAHKTGNWVAASHDVGIVYSPAATYVIAILSDKDWDNSEAIARISRIVYDYFNTS